MTAPQYETYDDAKRLRELYWEAGLSQKQIAELYSVSRVAIGRAMKRNGVESRQSAGVTSGYCNYSTGKQGYERWNSDGETVYVHQLSAIAGGADPEKVFGDDYVVHHENRVPWDNRRENLSVVTHQEHAQIHSEERHHQQYTDEDLIEWIVSFVEVVGVVPTAYQMSESPGPASKTFADRFGSWSEAVREAGYTPRGEQ